MKENKLDFLIIYAMTVMNGMKVENGENDMGRKTKKNSRPEESIIIRVSFGISKIFKYE